jgi:hypothetical protein
MCQSRGRADLPSRALALRSGSGVLDQRGSGTARAMSRVAATLPDAPGSRVAARGGLRRAAPTRLALPSDAQRLPRRGSPASGATSVPARWTAGHPPGAYGVPFPEARAGDRAGPFFAGSPLATDGLERIPGSREVRPRPPGPFSAALVGRLARGASVRPYPFLPPLK